ncbi:MAG: LLM class flavin-dependent oxidoreductase, partial [Gammaproteobacteria bacterium]|nr:LLM class flavin-dependent oxidoreductase [Gammaproteobacteria bacterium]
RIVLGAGVGWLAEEFQALQAPDFASRGKVTDEYLEIVKRICAGGEVGFEGEHYRFDTLHARPASVQRPHPPIVIGGTSNAALRRVVRLGDGWLSAALSAERHAERLARLRELCVQAGRDYEALQLHHKLFINIGEARQSVSGGREPGTGSRARIVDDLKAMADLGVGSIIVRYIGEDTERQREQLECFAGEIAPRV